MCWRSIARHPESSRGLHLAGSSRRHLLTTTVLPPAFSILAHCLFWATGFSILDGSCPPDCKLEMLHIILPEHPNGVVIPVLLRMPQVSVALVKQLCALGLISQSQTWMCKEVTVCNQNWVLKPRFPRPPHPHLCCCGKFFLLAIQGLKVTSVLDCILLWVNVCKLQVPSLPLPFFLLGVICYLLVKRLISYFGIMERQSTLHAILWPW